MAAVKFTLAEIKKILAARPDEEQIRVLLADERSGVQKLLAAYEKKLAREAREKERFAAMLRYENEYYAQGARFIAGVDEAGRGPLAAHLVIAAAIMPRDFFISGLNDSKQLSAAARERLYDEVLARAVSVSVNIVSVSNVDTRNIYRATQEGMQEALAHLSVPADVALIDAMPLRSGAGKIVPIIHGDALSATIAAASIIAKVTRDRIMVRLDALYPAYGFQNNKGYGSREHMQALAVYGATRWHRRSYEPVRSMGLPALPPSDNILYSPLSDKYTYEPQD